METISTHDVGFMLFVVLFCTSFVSKTLICIFVHLSSVRPFYQANGAHALHAVQQHGGGVRSAIPSAAGGSVLEAIGATAGEG